MNLEHLFLFLCIGLVKGLNTECFRDDIVERFSYTSDVVAEKPLHHESDVQKEFVIIARKVTWMEAKLLCPSYDDQPSEQSPRETQVALEISKKKKNLAKGNSKKSNSSLAIFTDEGQANWLAQMLSESNYRYEGLWIAGTRRNKTANWYWISDHRLKNNRVPKNILVESYPSWYHISTEVIGQQNCLLFNRIGHDIPVFNPENCELRRPFICMRDVKKKLADKISEGASVTIDDHRYTLYNVIDDGKAKYFDSGVKKLNGGGIKWKDARIECKRRGKQLAIIESNEAAAAIAEMMLRNRPSMENAWLGGWSLDGTEWIWEPTGTTLEVVKSRATGYPPWLDTHPIIMSKNDYFYERRSRCLILDRHLCPEQIAPVFLDLDCEKERPFICQDGKIPDCPECEQDYTESRNGLVPRNLARRSTIDNEELEFSEELMTYQDAEDYCINRDGQIANIMTSKILSVCLEKMSELEINHVWVGGRTVQKNGKWHWVDSNGKPLSPKGIGSGNTWCLGEENGHLPKAEPNSCLNLDYEARGYPLFYALPCNSTQVVLCSAPFNATKEQVAEVQSDEVDTRIIGDLDGSVNRYANRALNSLKDVTMNGMKVLKDLKNLKKPKHRGRDKPAETHQTTSAPTTAKSSTTTGSIPSTAPSQAPVAASSPTTAAKTTDAPTATPAPAPVATPDTPSTSPSLNASSTSPSPDASSTPMKPNDAPTTTPAATPMASPDVSSTSASPDASSTPASAEAASKTPELSPTPGATEATTAKQS